MIIPKVDKPSFLVKLYEILEDGKNKKYIRWVDEGQGFIIECVPSFCENVLPHYFKHNNFPSFIRQLNMYDFYKKSRIQNSENIFRHP